MSQESDTLLQDAAVLSAALSSAGASKLSAELSASLVKLANQLSTTRPDGWELVMRQWLDVLAARHAPTTWGACARDIARSLLSLETQSPETLNGIWLRLDPSWGTDPWPLDQASRSMLHEAGLLVGAPISLAVELSSYESTTYTASGTLVYTHSGVTHQEYVAEVCSRLSACDLEARQHLADLLDDNFQGGIDALLSELEHA